MRTLIVLALIGTAFASEAYFAQAPLGYSSYIVDEPKPSYEYSTSVQTPSYNNYAHVRSGPEFERKIYNFATPFGAPILAAQPIVAEAKILPATPILKAEPLLKPQQIFSSESFFKAEPILKAEPLLRAEPFFKAEPILKASPVLKASPLSAELKPAFAAIPDFGSTKLLPVAFEPKPIDQRFLSFYRYAPAPTIVAAEPAPAPVAFVENRLAEAKFIGEKSQYHSQNELGEATYGHREQFQSHDAVQDAEGNKAGSFSYVAPDGRVLTTEYIADKAGYRVASNALPVAQNPIPAPVIAAEKPVEFDNNDGIVVEAKSRSRRSVAAFAAPPLAEPILSSRASLYYQSPLAYSYQPYSSYSYAAPSFYSGYSAPLYRPYSYAYPQNLYYKNFAFRK